MRKYLKYFYFFLLNLIIKARFIRITPYFAGYIYFFDREKNNFFKLKSRGYIDSITADQIFTKHDYNLKFLKRYEELLRYYRKIIDEKKTPLIIDCGANVGYASIYFSNEFPKAKIYSIEPESNNYKLLRQNTINFENIYPVSKAISSTVTEYHLKNPDADFNAFQIESIKDYPNHENKNLIQSTDINSLINENPNTIPFLVKIDIEGFESNLFEKNYEWIEKVPLIIVELHDWLILKEANSSNFLRAISKYNRDFIISGENVFSIDNQKVY